MTMPRDHRWLGDLACAAGRIEPGEAPGKLLSCTIEDAWNAVCDAGAMTPPELAQLVAERFGLPLADFSDVDPAAAALVPPEAYRDRLMRVLRRGPQGLEVAIADASDIHLPRLLHFMTSEMAVLSIATPAELRAQPVPETDAQLARVTSDLIDIDGATGGEPAIVRLCSQIFRQAVDRGASDIHVQPHGSGGVIRMRIDGVLRRVATLQHAVMLRLVARIKLVASMDPTDRTRAQDGRLRLRLGGHTHDVRVSSVPANDGEKLVTRILGSSKVLTLRELAIGQPELDQLCQLVSRGQGLVLVTGPTGSGKTTTLYSALAEVNEPGVSIATVEDPVEIRLPWLAQIEVNPKSDLTFANALRAVLRQDPDVVLIGEIRDPETAQIAIQAALTGHLVLASLHTNDAVMAITRLLGIGLQAQQMCEALAGASAQRLVRRLCPACARPAQVQSEGAQWLARYAGIEQLMEARGCAQCADTGYRGRLAISQVFEFTAEMAELVEARRPLAQVRALAREQGMRTLAESAADRLRAGQTSLEEVQRSLGSDFWLDLGRVYSVAPFRETFAARAATRAHGDAPLLVIWDNAKQRRQASKAFRLAGYQVLEAEDAEAGRDFLRRDGAAIAIVADLHPGLGPGLLGLRETVGGAAVPIIALREASEIVDPVLQGRPGVAVRERPDDYELLPGLLRDAIADIDRDLGALLGGAMGPDAV